MSPIRCSRSPRRVAASSLLIGAALCSLAGCYHYAFDQRTPGRGEVLETHSERRLTYFGGLVGTGDLETTRFCANPVRTEVKVRASDALIWIGTLLIYTPHTVTVTCPAPAQTATREGTSGR